MGLSIPDGCRSSSFSLPDGVGSGNLGFFDGCKAQGLSIQGHIGVDGSGFFNGFGCLRLIPMEFHA